MGLNDRTAKRQEQIRAAQYVRMSTDHQQYSTRNQMDALRDYAERRGLAIVRTFADEGKSGLGLYNRPALKQLLHEVQAGSANFSTILVFDVSRWGRFQDADESAYYEYICRRSGIAVEYCQEHFENDGSPVSTIVKSVKRAMAAEYSRELSEKVFAGKKRIVELGFRVGGSAGLGLRRVLVGPDGMPKGELRFGERKSIMTDRTILVPGPPDEIETVNEIFRYFLAGETLVGISRNLNARGLTTPRGSRWTAISARDVLTNEAYRGNNVWARNRGKLTAPKRPVHPDSWVRADGVFTPIVDEARFAAVQAKLRRWKLSMPSDEMIEGLKRLLREKGQLNSDIINADRRIPWSCTYKARFGSLYRAYEFAGYRCRIDEKYLATNRNVARCRRSLNEDIATAAVRAGATLVLDETLGRMTVNGEITAVLAVIRCTETGTGYPRWEIPLGDEDAPDVLVAARMDAMNRDVLDYYLIPKGAFACRHLRLAERNSVDIDAYRFDSLDPFHAMLRRRSVLEMSNE